MENRRRAGVESMFSQMGVKNLDLTENMVKASNLSDLTFEFIHLTSHHRSDLKVMDVCSDVVKCAFFHSPVHYTMNSMLLFTP